MLESNLKRLSGAKSQVSHFTLFCVAGSGLVPAQTERKNSKLNFNNIKMRRTNLYEPTTEI